MGNEVCVDRELFDRVEIGHQVRLVGFTSRYAVEPKRVELLITTMHNKRFDPAQERRAAQPEWLAGTLRASQL